MEITDPEAIRILLLLLSICQIMQWLLNFYYLSDGTYKSKREALIAFIPGKFLYNAIYLIFIKIPLNIATFFKDAYEKYISLPKGV